MGPFLLQPAVPEGPPCDSSERRSRRMKGLSILGSTGSVGTNVLRVVDAFPDRLSVVALAAGGNVDRLAEQVARYRPQAVSVATAEAAEALGRLVDLSGVRVGVGRDGAVA